MPDQPDPNKRVLSVRIAREFYRRLQIEAQRRQMGFNEYVRFLIYKETENISLTKEDYDVIERERVASVKRARTGGRSPKGRKNG